MAEHRDALGVEVLGPLRVVSGHVTPAGAIHHANGDVLERRLATSSFPYAVRYRVTDGQLIVMAVYHQRRRPDFGADRLP